MSISTIVFDIDGTLAPPSAPLSPRIAQGLRTLERRGYRIGFASGKTCLFIEGFARAAGLRRFFAVGENGAMYMDRYNGEVTHLAQRPSSVDALERALPSMWDDVCFKRNTIILSVFSENPKTLRAVFERLKSDGWDSRNDVIAYFHDDCVDIVPAGVDKGTGMAYYLQQSGLDASELLAVGDGINDGPLKREAGLFYAVGDGIDACLNFDSREDMMTYLLAHYPPVLNEQ